MGHRLDAMLEPGERVLYRHRRSVRELVSLWLRVEVFSVALALLAIAALFNWVWPDMMAHFGVFFRAGMVILVVGLPLTLYQRQEVMITERRLLRHDLYDSVTTVVPLSEIAALRGLSPLEFDLIRVETFRGRVHEFGVPDRRAFARVLAKAVGLPMPPAVPPIAERVARVILAAGTWGLVLGCLILPLTAIAVTFNHIDPDNITVLGFITIALTVTLIVPVVSGLMLGWLAGNLLVFACLRPLITADELRAAF